MPRGKMERCPTCGAPVKTVVQYVKTGRKPGRRAKKERASATH